MKIVRMSNGDWGNTKAYFDIKTDEGFIIKGCRLVDSSNGLFVSFPSRKKDDGEYGNIVFIEKESKQLRTDVHKLALKHYETPAELVSDGVVDDAPMVNDALQSNESDFPF